MSTSGPSYGERAEFGEADVCYRHPDRQSFTLCQRCGRTICAECQIVSPVGVLCPECARQAGGAAQQRGAARLTRSARVASRRFAGVDSPMTLAIIAVSAAVFVLQLLGYYFGGDGVTKALRYIPMYSLPSGIMIVPPGVDEGYPGGLATSFEPWRLATVMLTHSVTFLPHILFNMLTLYLFGRNLEAMIGPWRFLTLYVLSGIGGSLGPMFWGYADTLGVFTPTVGASGAIFGVLAATVVAFRAIDANVTSLIVMIAINFGLGFMQNSNISWQAHLGGMVFGALVMWVFVQTRGPRRRTAQIVSLSAVGVVLVVLSCAYLVVSPL